MITFALDGTGLYVTDPIHLDALLAWALVPFQTEMYNIGRSDIPEDIQLPIDRWHTGDAWGWKASALFPDGDTTESIQYWRKKFRQNRIELMQGSANLQMGIYREYNVPMSLLLCSKMSAYAVGDRGRVEQILRKNIKYLGKKRSYGKGKVIDVKVEIIDNDYSMIKDGCAMRWLPDEKGIRFVRTRPPYWNRIDRVNCCEVGDKYKI